MSTCIFIASDAPLALYSPPRDYPINIDVDKGVIDDGGADDNYFLFPFKNVSDYTDKKYGVCVEWTYTDGRAERIVEYIKYALLSSDSIELWRVWLMDYCEYEDSPVIHNKRVSKDELTTDHIREIDNANIWNTPDKRYPERPSFYCLTVYK